MASDPHGIPTDRKPESSKPLTDLPKQAIYKKPGSATLGRSYFDFPSKTFTNKAKKSNITPNFNPASFKSDMSMGNSQIPYAKRSKANLYDIDFYESVRKSKEFDGFIMGRVTPNIKTVGFKFVDELCKKSKLVNSMLEDESTQKLARKHLRRSKNQITTNSTTMETADEPLKRLFSESFTLQNVNPINTRGNSTDLGENFPLDQSLIDIGGKNNIDVLCSPQKVSQEIEDFDFRLKMGTNKSDRSKFSMVRKAKMDNFFTG